MHMHQKGWGSHALADVNHAPICLPVTSWVQFTVSGVDPYTLVRVFLNWDSWLKNSSDHSLRWIHHWIFNDQNSLNFHFTIYSLLFLDLVLQEVCIRLGLDGCSAICYPATRPSKLLDGYQGHPLFLPVAWDCPAATEPGSETVYTRHTLFSQHL